MGETKPSAAAVLARRWCPLTSLHENTTNRCHYCERLTGELDRLTADAVAARDREWREACGDFDPPDTDGRGSPAECVRAFEKYIRGTNAAVDLTIGPLVATGLWVGGSLWQAFR